MYHHEKGTFEGCTAHAYTTDFTAYQRKLRGLLLSFLILSFTPVNPLQVSLICECYHKESLFVVRIAKVRPYPAGVTTWMGDP